MAEEKRGSGVEWKGVVLTRRGFQCWHFQIAKKRMEFVWRILSHYLRFEMDPFLIGFHD